MVSILRKHAESIEEPALQGRWIAMLENMDSFKNFFVEAASLSFPKIAAQPRPVEGRNRFYPQIADIDGINLTLYENKTFKASKYISEWKKSVYNPETGTYGLPKDYKRSVTVLFLAHNSDTPVCRLVYKNCWPTDRVAREVNYSEIDGRLSASVQLQVDGVDEIFV